MPENFLFFRYIWAPGCFLRDQIRVKKFRTKIVPGHVAGSSGKTIMKIQHFFFSVILLLSEWPAFSLRDQVKRTYPGYYLN